MSEAFVKIGVKVIADVTVGCYELTSGFVNDKLLVHAAAVCRFSVGRGKIADGYAFRAMFTAHPVGIGQIDADGGRGVKVAAEYGRGDDFG